MLKYIEVTAKTEDEAIANGLAQLGLNRDDVSVEILNRGKVGFLGIGSVPAKVKLTYEVPNEAEPVLENAVVQVPKEKLKLNFEKKQEFKSKDRPIASASKNRDSGVEPAVSTLKGEPVNDEVSAAILKFQTGLFAQMGVEVTPTVTWDGDIYQVVLSGENMGAIIGHRGETLDAIQQLTSYAVNRGRSPRVRIHVDAEGYRIRREESLNRLAHKTAEKVVKYRRNITLEPMNAYERHVIHTALQDFPGVSTYSTGNEPNRRTVVAYDPSKQK